MILLQNGGFLGNEPGFHKQLELTNGYWFYGTELLIDYGSNMKWAGYQNPPRIWTGRNAESVKPIRAMNRWINIGIAWKKKPIKEFQLTSFSFLWMNPISSIAIDNRKPTGKSHFRSFIQRQTRLIHFNRIFKRVATHSADAVNQYSNVKMVT